MQTLSEDQVREIAQQVLNGADIDVPDEEIARVALPLIRKEITTAISKRVVVRIEQNGKRAKETDLGLQHKRFADLLRLANVRTHDGSRLNVWLAGPAGTGKTTAAQNVAKALGVPFFFNGAIDSEHKLLGFTDANGRIVSRPFRKAFTEGGVYLFDEVDGSLPAALLAFNAALANGHCDFPDGCVKRHQDCFVIAAANTWGTSSSPEYVGRMKQDAAFLDRFVFLDWPVDETLESAVAASMGQLDWATEVQRYRAKANEHGVRVVISPRSTYTGAAMLAAGIDKASVISATVRRGMSDDAWNKLASN